MKAYFQNWNFMRLLRFVLGVAILVQGIMYRDWFAIFLGAAFGGMAIANIGCCGVGSCAVDKRSLSSQPANVEFEEVTTSK